MQTEAHQQSYETITSRARMLRRAGIAGAGIAVAALAATACSSGSPSQAGHPSKDTVTGGSSAAHVVQAAYTKTTASKTAKVSITAGGAQGSSTAGQQVAVTGSGVVNFGSRAADITMKLPTGNQMEIRYLTGAEYLHTTPAAAMSKLTGSDRMWAKLDLNKLLQAKTGKTMQQLQQNVPTDPSAQLGYLRGVSDKVTKLGPATIAGTRTTGYQTSIDLSKVAARAGGKATSRITALEKQLGSRTLPVKVWTDAQGRLRRLTIAETIKPTAATAAGGTEAKPVTVHLSETISDYGTPADITAPPASQTTDITNKITNAVGNH
ncbi:MAG TPA: hypothetical protein VGH85_17810 [Mycobacteriales bacterium]|jgi:hypothetical protein